MTLDTKALFPPNPFSTVPLEPTVTLQTWYLDPRSVQTVLLNVGGVVVTHCSVQHSLYFLISGDTDGSLHLVYGPQNEAARPHFQNKIQQAAVRVSLHGIFQNSSFVHLVLLRQAQGFSVAVAHRNNAPQCFFSPLSED